MNPTEARLAEIWRVVLGVPEVGRRHDFFAVGGDSLLATKAVLHIRRTWPIAVTVRDLIECPVFEDLARWIDQRARAEHVSGDSRDGQG